MGDPIDSSKTKADIALEFINRAKKISPLYFVSGNHEVWSGEYELLKKSPLEEGVVVLMMKEW